jgi:hypothetical protein
MAKRAGSVPQDKAGTDYFARSVQTAGLPLQSQYRVTARLGRKVADDSWPAKTDVAHRLSFSRILTSG